ncbi:hypothetical protein SADUNF_Sadunf11G0119700 [Salix dunnii]|uniref:histidinol dehydrogenase n=1 Tax=Salix dunnii TaxID=1413687 RepID=A0A835MPN7_9ROSI|nr:hypothetical protein SADUNF_Sadunf11G0119700 [Salix dunnii]
MWSNNNDDDNNSTSRGFWTPPASWRSQQSPKVAMMPMSERKERVYHPSCKRDLFHVVHKVPAGDSPYVRAKHVQLIEKDPSKAVSLFWAAINAGDRVDSALKDMAVVMKQLDRADEAIEAIKSFRHLCPCDSQESIDNVLVELYKRSGRIEEEIEMLRCKLKLIEEGIVFSGKKTKTARSHGRKIQINVEQERSRILGNLAWAYLQHHDYGLAEQHYRKALSLEPDQNKQCNLAICLMHMNRIPEAKSLLQTVKALSGSKPMDDSYAKSFERACQILAEFESHSRVNPTKQNEDHQRSLPLPTTRNLKQVAGSPNGDPYVSGFMDSIKCTGGFNEERMLADEQNRRYNRQNRSENEKSFFVYNNRNSHCISSELRGPQSSPQTAADNSWRRGSYFEGPVERLGFASKMKENRCSFTETGPASAQKKTAITSPALFTQPRRCTLGGFDQGDQIRIMWGEDTVETKKENGIRNLSEELLGSSDDHNTSWKRNVRENVGQRKSAREDSNASLKCPREQTAFIDKAGVLKDSTDCDWDQSADTSRSKSLGQDRILKSRRKSWADMVEEEEEEGEEQELFTVDLGQGFNSWNHEDASTDENLNANIVHQNSYQKFQQGTICQKLEAVDLQDSISTMNAVSLRNRTARRSLSYESAEDANTKRRNRWYRYYPTLNAVSSRNPTTRRSLSCESAEDANTEEKQVADLYFTACSPPPVPPQLSINRHIHLSRLIAYNLILKSEFLIMPFTVINLIDSRYNPSSNFSLGCKLKRAMCAMKSYRLSELSNAEVESLKARPRIDFSSIFGTVIADSNEVRPMELFICSCSYTAKFDKVKLDKIVENVFELPDPELEAAVREAFDVAYDNIYAFHLAQRSAEKSIENMKGVRCKRVARSIGSVGLYVPGGTAVLPSTALMLAIPAQIAGCKTVVLATPPSQDGSICKEVLYCAKKAGVTHILKAGGAQAISAMAWGTDSCPKVEKIFGPGNQYVTAAKMILQNSEAMISIDMPAGPSEVLVIADRYASPVHIAADLLSQAEHGPDSQVVLVVAGDGVDMKTIEDEISKQCQCLPRGEYASKALSHSFTVFARDMVEALSFSNLYAPEHLIINVKDAEKWESFIENAGSVFLGPWTPESVGDYASGTNHVLPTYGYARMYGGVSLDSFQKYMTVQSLTEEGLRMLGPYVATMAEVEGLDAHKRAVTLRLQDIEARQVSNMA